MSSLEQFKLQIYKNVDCSPNNQIYQGTIDSKIIEVFILHLDLEEMHKHYMQENYAAVLADKIYNQFMNSVSLGNADLPLEQGECPIDFKIHKSFTVPLVLFDENLMNNPFPIYLKYNPKLDSDCKSHKERVGNYLKIVSPEIFEALAFIIDANKDENI